MNHSYHKISPVTIRETQLELTMTALTTLTQFNQREEVITNYESIYRPFGHSGRVWSSYIHLGNVILAQADCDLRKQSAVNFLYRRLKMAKAKDKVVEETKTIKVIETPAYSDDKLVAWGQVTLFQETEAGLAELKANLTLADLVNINRQRKTDVKNNLRRLAEVEAIWAKVQAGKANLAELTKALNALTKSNPSKELQADLNKLLANFTK